LFDVVEQEVDKLHNAEIDIRKEEEYPQYHRMYDGHNSCDKRRQNGDVNHFEEEEERFDQNPESIEKFFRIKIVAPFTKGNAL
jgi:hypothetical protein